MGQCGQQLEEPPPTQRTLYLTAQTSSKEPLFGQGGRRQECELIFTPGERSPTPAAGLLSLSRDTELFPQLTVQVCS